MQFEPIVLGYVVSTVTLVAEHILLWPATWRVEKPWSYVVGVLTLLFGCLVWARTVHGPIDPLEALAAFALICTSGKWIIVAYWLRDRDARRKRAAQLTGEALAMTQDLIDNGGRHAAGKPSLHDRRN